MSCLKSFVIRSTANENVTSGAELDLWGISPTISWAYLADKTSTFNVQGFKNINIHAIEAVGDFGNNRNMNTNFGSVVSDWAFRFSLTGTMSTVSGNITASPNPFLFTQPIGNPLIDLSKFTPKITFPDPIQSVRTIQLTGVRAYGTSAENLTTINIGWLMNFIFYYSYEGEEQEFAFL